MAGAVLMCGGGVDLCATDALRDSWQCMCCVRCRLITCIVYTPQRLAPLANNLQCVHSHAVEQIKLIFLVLPAGQ